MSGIHLEQVNRRYGSVVAVRDVSMMVAPGEFVTLLGPSGSGKTTTLRMIAGLEQPSSGIIRIGERVVFDGRERVATADRNLGMVFQSYAVWPHKTVFENVAFPLRQRRVAAAETARRVGEILDMVELAGLAARYPSELSGGQQQRVALARALVARPEVVLFDEPLSNLDSQLRESMRSLLQTLHQRFRFTAVYVTHDQTEAMVLSDRVHVMNRGAIVQSDNPRTLYERPCNLFVASFIGQTNLLPIVDRAPGLVRLAGGQTLYVDTDATDHAAAVAIRPHHVHFAAEDDTETNVIAGRVAQTAYLGDRVTYRITIAGDLAVTVEIPARADLPMTGTEVRLRIPAENCLLLRAS